jgi:hypothetical protein
MRPAMPLLLRPPYDHLSYVTPAQLLEACAAPVWLAVDHVDIQLAGVQAVVTPHSTTCSNVTTLSRGGVHAASVRCVAARSSADQQLWQLAHVQPLLVACTECSRLQGDRHQTSHLRRLSTCCCSSATWPLHLPALPAHHMHTTQSCRV